MLFLFPVLPSDPAPATFGGVFVAGSWGVAVRDMFVAGNCLCVMELLNVHAAKGEQGEVGSGWCTGSWAPPACLVCLILRCAVHVQDRFFVSGPLKLSTHSNSKVCPHFGSKFVWLFRGVGWGVSGYGKFPKIYGGGGSTKILMG